MAKRTASLELMLPLRQPGTAAIAWLYTAVRSAILDGRMRPGTRLPSTREVAVRYGLSRGTIVNAFDQLKSEGYLEGSVGSGTYVSNVLPDELFRADSPPQAASRGGRTQHQRTSGYGGRVKPFPVLEMRPPRAFRPNIPALDLFPTALWTKILTRRLRHAPTALLLGCEPMGYMPLRVAVADYLNISRGVKCVPEQVAIVSGVQEAIDLVARLFLDPGDKVVMENPGYPGAAIAFSSVGADVLPARVDDEGVVLADRNLKGVRLAYVTPAHQFPLGVTMSLRRRLELLERARESGTLILEDDYDSEFRYSSRPVPALQGLDRNGIVLFAGSFSKVMFPSLRLGYLVVPSRLVHLFEATKSITSRHPPLVEQAVLSDFITGGDFGRHLRRMREVYGERLSVLLDESRQRLKGLLEISDVEAGLQTAGWLGKGIDAESVSRSAAGRNVEVIPLGRYSMGRISRQGLQLGFAAVDEPEIRRGVRELGIVLEHQARRR